jgi:hypothetical protein
MYKEQIGRLFILSYSVGMTTLAVSLGIAQIVVA